MLPSHASTDLQVKMENVIHMISQFNGAVVALSAGVDSSLVAALARKALGDRVVAVTALSESLAPGEVEIAQKTATQIGIRHVIVTTDEVHNTSYKSNPSNRCYYCKDTLYRELRRQADKSSFEAVLDGTQLDDLGDSRPGLLAAREAGVEALSQKRVSLRKRCGKLLDFWGLMYGTNQPCRVSHPGYHTARRSRFR